MSSQKYISQYRQFLISMYQAQLITLAAGAALESFPRNLPVGLRSGLADAMRNVSAAITTLIEGSENPKSKGRKDRTIRLEMPEAPNSVFTPMLSLYAHLVQEGQEPSSIDFQSTLYRQQLVMIVAHVEAFLGDSIRAICREQPRVLESAQKHVSWSLALSFADRDALLSALTDNYVSFLTQGKDANNLLAQLKRELNLDVHIASETLKFFSLAEQVRHIIVHNGARVDTKFNEKTGWQNNIGDVFVVDKKFIETATVASRTLAQAVFAAVAKKFYSLDDPLKEAGSHFNVDHPGSSASVNTRTRRKKQKG